ncbi:hypothetical protein [Streptacidiphilus rugosus]|uniref:hypothetical protein n=1 Tax=Streptacidiphilus rugosus TaxID=405783 RepID=UPI00068C0712|nr:hypothetical protein [Streptacidiphilus rugosus]
MGAASAVLAVSLLPGLAGCHVAVSADHAGGRGSGAGTVTVIPATPSATTSPNPGTPAATATTGGPASSHAAAPRSAPSRVPLPVGSCVGPAAQHYPGVSCSAANALARVIARRTAAATGAAAACPPGTDFSLAVSVRSAGSPTDQPSGKACLRRLHAPHPGDPGGGAGDWLLPGDCLVEATGGLLHATPCTTDGTADHRPRFRITALASSPSACPPTTQATIQLHNPGHPTQFGCLVPTTGTPD